MAQLLKQINPARPVSRWLRILPFLLALFLFAVAALAAVNSVRASGVAVMTRVSTSAAGSQGDSVSEAASVSPDGRYVAFASFASNLVPGDTNNTSDVFIKDTQTAAITRVSTSAAGVEGNYLSDNPSLSADGRFVAFTSRSTSLVSGDTNSQSDIFVKNLQTGAITRVSTTSEGVQGDYPSDNASMSADGRYVVFSSSATNFFSGDSNFSIDVFVKDTQTGVTTCVSTDAAGNQGNGYSMYPAISADGRYVAFSSYSSNLLAGDTMGQDVFLKDLQTGAIVRVSPFSDNQDVFSRNPAMTPDARYVSYSSNVVNPGYNVDVFRKDLQTGVIDQAGSQGNYWIENYANLTSAISSDGRYIAFGSMASDLVTGDTNGAEDVFLADMQTGEIEILSANLAGAKGDAASMRPAMDAGGQLIAFDSAATNLVSADSNGVSDVFLTPNQPDPSSDINYYFPWYDSQGGRTWVLMAQPSAGSTAAHDNSYDVFLKSLGSPTMDLLTPGGLVVHQGETRNVFAPGRMGGPVKAVAHEGEGMVSERSLFGNSFEEVWASSYVDLDSHYWWPIYDSAAPGMKNWVLVANPPENGENVTARLKIHGTAVDETRNLTPGESWTPVYMGLSGGPVEVTAWRQGGSEASPADSRKVIASQRVLFDGAFNELPGIAASDVSDSYIWTWYDNIGGSNWIAVSNPSPSATIWGSVRVGSAASPVFETGGAIGPRQTRIFREPGMGGPVYAFGHTDSTGTVPADIVATQRVIWGPSFGEIAGTSEADRSFSTSTWTWYDQKEPGVTNWVLIANPAAQQIYAEIRIAGQTVWGDTIDPGANRTPTFPNWMGGPVEVQAWVSQTDTGGNQLKQAAADVFASQRVVWNGYFNEVVGKGS